MIGTSKLMGLYVQPDQERDIEGRHVLVPGFAVEVVKVEGCEKPGGGRAFEGRIFGLARRDMKHPRPYSTPLARGYEALVGGRDLRRTCPGGVARRRRRDVARGGETLC
jgi:hypothetical protein